MQPIEIAPEGITLTRALARRLQVSTGDTLRVDVMEGRQRKLELPVSATVDEVIGMAAYMDIRALNALTGEGNVVSAAALYVDPASIDMLSQRLKTLPTTETVSMKAYTLTSFLDKIANLVLVSAGILTAFAIILAAGVVYNSARIGLQERAWELASLRVLGFTSHEVSQVLFGEFIIEVGVAIPLGIAASQAIVDLITTLHSSESFQRPGVINPSTFTIASLIVLGAALGSGYLVRRRIDRLDLVGVLKARD